MSANTEILLADQKHVIRSIERTVENFRKIGKKNFSESITRNRLQLLDSNWKRCQELHAQLVTLASDEFKADEDYFIQAKFDATEDVFLGASDFLHEILDEFEKPNISASSPIDRESCSTSNRDAPPPQPHLIPLPSIAPPKFSGKYEEWESFRDLFTSLVNDNISLTNVQRMHYLKTSLTGEADRLLRNFSVTADNYRVAWTTLSSRYENLRIILSSHLNALIKTPSSKTGSVRELTLIRDSFNDAIAALRNHKRPVDTWDDLLVALLHSKLDIDTIRDWERNQGNATAFPSYKELDAFLNTRIRVAEAVETSTFPQTSSKNLNVKLHQQFKTQAHVSAVTPSKCVLCSDSHALYMCPIFQKFPVGKRNSVVKQHHCCPNCLSFQHVLSKCRSHHRCFRCRKQHHTLLHTDYEVSKRENRISDPEVTQSTASELDLEPPTVARCNAARSNSSILLATAWVKVLTSEGREERVRALIDPGSETTFITESLTQTLRMKRRRVNVQVTGIGGNVLANVKHCVDLTLASCHEKGDQIPATALVLPRLTSYGQPRACRQEFVAQFSDLRLADADPTDATEVDMLIGADLYGSILRDGLRRGDSDKPTAQCTLFGWILFGPIRNTKVAFPFSTRAFHCTSLVDVDTLLQKFWVTEEVAAEIPLTSEESQCEEHFAATHRRSADGRYIVRLPFKSPPPLEIGYSRTKANLLYSKLEQRLARTPALANDYDAFLKDYESAGHMKRVDESSTHNQCVYLPHHAVLRESSSTTRTRVVFNASSVTSNGSSLNDHLLIGPKLQADLPSVVMRWRRYRYVYTADITQMFRQIGIDEHDRDYQRILWRPNAQEPVQTYQLCTVTYGTASAPFLANRVLKQLAADEGPKYPLAKRVLEEDFYVDDSLFGNFEKDSVIKTRVQLTQLLEAGGFKLRKWSANHADLLTDIPVHDCTSSKEYPLNEDESMKVLGIVWLPHIDAFKFNGSIAPQVCNSKRTVLSIIARIFDPLGWISPVVVGAKIFMQELWLRKDGWDNPLPLDLQQKWSEYCEDLRALDTLQIPRWTGQLEIKPICEIHGFADASTRAYGAVVYLRLQHPASETTVTLLISKTKVAPLKTLSVPRLELNAAVLLTKLIRFTKRTLELNDAPVYCWTDSTVTLAWIRRPPATWKTFVANRVSIIHTELPHASWQHVPTQENPADCASRGIKASVLLNHPLWWSGPPWLRFDKHAWPVQNNFVSENADTESRSTTLVAQLHEKAEWNLPEKFSSWPRLLRVTAYCKRFIHNIRCRIKREPIASTRAVLSHEVQQSSRFWTKYVQQLHFSSEINSLKTGSRLTKSPLVNVNPFLDREDILRVGGRLRNAPLSYSEKHPIILPRHRISELIAEDAHRRALHGGPQLTLRIMRQEYWILGDRNLTKKVIFHCVPCTRIKAKIPSQIMSDLPEYRVTPSRTFLHCGVDYAGPVHVIPIVGRGQRSRKAYIAVFVCLSTRAIHLELVGAYSTDSFLGAFRRFISRRGLPSDIYSDNGTNFRGADTELRGVFDKICRDPNLLSTLASDRVTWHFMPPAAPHFGGIWEAGVKSMKHHLRRTLGTNTLSIEEFGTLLAQVEACLNSRPIGPTTSDPRDNAALTPGHFLIGAPLVSLPEQSVLCVNENRLSRWQKVRKILESFWQVWSQDYLHTLQQRNKWKVSQPDFQVDDLVLIRNPLAPPSKWELGRVLQVHLGPDGHPRVVNVKTAKTTRKRPITQLCRLPIDNNSKRNDCTTAGGSL